MAELDVVVIEGDSLLLLPLGFAPPVAALLWLGGLAVLWFYFFILFYIYWEYLWRI
jgi:hypothetical protein